MNKQKLTLLLYSSKQMFKHSALLNNDNRVVLFCQCNTATATNHRFNMFGQVCQGPAQSVTIKFTFYHCQMIFRTR